VFAQQTKSFKDKPGLTLYLAFHAGQLSD